MCVLPPCIDAGPDVRINIGDGKNGFIVGNMYTLLTDYYNNEVDYH